MFLHHKDTRKQVSAFTLWGSDQRVGCYLHPNDEHGERGKTEHTEKAVTQGMP